MVHDGSSESSWEEKDDDELNYEDGFIDRVLIQGSPCMVKEHGLFKEGAIA